MHTRFSSAIDRDGPTHVSSLHQPSAASSSDIIRPDSSRSSLLGRPSTSLNLVEDTPSVLDSYSFTTTSKLPPPSSPANSSFDDANTDFVFSALKNDPSGSPLSSSLNNSINSSALTRHRYSSSSSSSFKHLPTCLTSSRMCTFLSFCFGFSLIIAVLVIFLILYHRDLSHPDGANGNQNVFKMQLLGQSVLRYEITKDQPTPTAVSNSESWLRDWSSILTGDFVMTDLETSFTGKYPGFDWRGNIYAHIAPQATVDNLVQMGITSFVCANNHLYDLSVGGFYNLIDVLNLHHLFCPGFGNNLHDASSVYLQTDRNNSKSIEVGVIAFASGSLNSSGVATDDRMGVNQVRIDSTGQPNAADLQVQFDAIEESINSHNSDLIVVYHHNHYVQNSSLPPETVEPWRQVLARRMIDAGANMYFSHGQPVFSGIELYRGAPIFYGLGNFIFQSLAGVERWGVEAYDSVQIDLEYGCRTCDRAKLPVAAMGTITQGKKMINKLKKMITNAVGTIDRRTGKNRRSMKHQPDTGFTEMTTDEELWQSCHPHSTGEEYRVCAKDGSTSFASSDSSSSPLSISSESSPFPTLPPRPSSAGPHTSTCPCGLYPSSILIRPLILQRPDLIPTGRMDFNHSWGLPTFDMTLEQAKEILTRLKERSEPFGTEIEIVNNIQSNHPHSSVSSPSSSSGQLADDSIHSMVNLLFARVKLDPEQD